METNIKSVTLLGKNRDYNPGINHTFHSFSVKTRDNQIFEVPIKHAIFHSFNVGETIFVSYVKVDFQKARVTYHKSLEAAEIANAADANAMTNATKKDGLSTLISGIVVLGFFPIALALIFGINYWYGTDVFASEESQVASYRQVERGVTSEERIREEQSTKEMGKEAFAGPVTPQEVFDPVTKTWHRPETFAAIMKFRERN
jgi:hypothetical protein